MKKLALLFIFLTSLVHAQYNIEGTMLSPVNTNWAILYKLDGTTEVYVANADLVKKELEDGDKKTPIATFNFTLPEDTKPGYYRIKYKTSGNSSFVDFIFNKENIAFTFNANYAAQTVNFSQSKENMLYKEYMVQNYNAQIKLDSIQAIKVNNATADISKPYTKALNTLDSIQTVYETRAKNYYALPLISANIRANPSTPLKSLDEYSSNITNMFFNNIDFSNPVIKNSPIIISRIFESLYFINASKGIKPEKQLYEQNLTKVLSKVTDNNYKLSLIQNLISKFTAFKAYEFVDFLINKPYKKLPENLQDTTYFNNINALLSSEVGRIAPDFSWEENAKTYTLSKLDGADNYLLVFWSSTCSHCLTQIPKLYESIKDNTKIKTVAFALENDAQKWTGLKQTLPNWHHALGLKKWENKVARTYNIYATPTYLILDKNKKIIAKPIRLEAVIKFIEGL